MPMSKITKPKSLADKQFKNNNKFTNFTKQQLTANCSGNYDTHIIYHTYDILYSMTTLLRVEGRSKLQS
jgi:hypothetical protein